MQNEIEAKFLDINKAKIRQKLKQLGATLEKPEVLMRRVVFQTDKHSFARVRDEGDQIVMTYKHVVDGHSILGTKKSTSKSTITMPPFSSSNVAGLRLKPTKKPSAKSGVLKILKFASTLGRGFHLL